MQTKIDRSFPCLVFLAKRCSEQNHELSKTSESDYVFFSPSISLKQHDPQCTRARAREDSAGGLLSDGHSGGYPCSSDLSC